MGDQRVVCVDLTEERDSERETHRQQGPPHGIVGTAGGNDGADRRERHQHERHQRDEPGRGPIRNLAPRGETQQIEETQERRKHDRECPKRQGSPCRRAEAYPTDSSLLLSLTLVSQPHSTGRPSPKRYEGRYERRRSHLPQRWVNKPAQAPSDPLATVNSNKNHPFARCAGLPAVPP
jgi:hypothetical protein